MVSVQSPVSILTHQGQISQIGANTSTNTTLGDNLISLEHHFWSVSPDYLLMKCKSVKRKSVLTLTPVTTVYPIPT